MRQEILTARDLKAFYVLQSSGVELVVKAVNGVTLGCYQSEVLGIAGESGCGKSSLLKVLFTMVEPPLRIVGGDVFYKIEKDTAVDVFSLHPRERRRLRWVFISYIPQGSMSVLNPVTKIKRTCFDILRSHGYRKTTKEAFEMLTNHLKELGLPSKVLNWYPHQLSGGMRQRLNIAVATVLRPKVILADEPTTALDVVSQRGVIQLLKKVQNQWGTSQILVTHDMGVQANMADRICIMYAGRIVEEADVQTIFESPLHPYTQYLIKSLPTFDSRARRESAPGAPPALSNLPTGCAFHPRCPYSFNKCVEKKPQLKEIKGGHKVACWLTGGRG